MDRSFRDDGIKHGRFQSNIKKYDGHLTVARILNLRKEKRTHESYDANQTDGLLGQQHVYKIAQLWTRCRLWGASCWAVPDIIYGSGHPSTGDHRIKKMS